MDGLFSMGLGESQIVSTQRPEKSHYRLKGQWKANKMPLGMSKVLSWSTQLTKFERNRCGIGICFSASAVKYFCSI